MDIQTALPLLAGLSPTQFMQQYWQKKPLLIRQALPGFTALLDRSALFALAGREGVESRLVMQEATSEEAVEGWQLTHGPFKRRALPALTQKQWTLLVQGVDTHDDAVYQLLQQFRFVPDARLDDLMVSYATEGGGVGPHFDSYDVFLLQAHGQRRWRIGQQQDLTLRDGVPLKVLAHFEYEEEFILNPGDMLYLPPRYAHDGVALSECMTYSIGFRAPDGHGLALELLQRMVDELVEDAADEASACEDDEDAHTNTAVACVSPKMLYRDPQQAAVAGPAAIPDALQAFAASQVQRVMAEADSLPRLLGESLTEPKPNAWFEAGSAPTVFSGVTLDRSTRMMYDTKHIFINGESYLAAGRDAVLMRALADQRSLDAKQLKKPSADAQSLLRDWCEAGWVHASA
jgi:50S ribosomal protein L16 3-hydroxylase